MVLDSHVINLTPGEGVNRVRRLIWSERGVLEKYSLAGEGEGITRLKVTLIDSRKSTRV